MEMYTRFESLPVESEVKEDALTGAYADMDRILKGTLVWPDVSAEAHEKYLHHPGPLMPHEMDVPTRDSLAKWSKNIQRIHLAHEKVLEPYGGLAQYAQSKGTSDWKALESMIRKELEPAGTVEVSDASVEAEDAGYPLQQAA